RSATRFSAPTASPAASARPAAAISESTAASVSRRACYSPAGGGAAQGDGMPRITALLAALAAVLIPKCPMCIAAYLSAAGVGAAFARAVAPVVVGAGRVCAGVAVAMLCVTAWRLLRRRKVQARSRGSSTPSAPCPRSFPRYVG
ncbi:MAG TPA: hypothetical protein VKE22_09490, partial [Haliangiales bacterium]|nr:hypothetical protein [Haliangiales bacterium]